MKDEIYKYFDWYYSTERYNIVFAKSLDEAINLKPMELPELAGMQKRLIDSFPVDLWEK